MGERTVVAAEAFELLGALPDAMRDGCGIRKAQSGRSLLSPPTPRIRG
jgi:hypothetical protein